MEDALDALNLRILDLEDELEWISQQDQLLLVLLGQQQERCPR